jgi:hypothetical protein
MAMGYVLLSLSWTTFSIPKNMTLLFETPDGVWGEAAVAAVKENFVAT